MGKKVMVKLVRKGDSSSINGALRDMTVGLIYEGYLPVEGEIDKDGFETEVHDELWIDSDDAGEAVVTRIGSSFEVIS